MFASRKVTAAIAFMLAFLMGSATPVEARPGIWMYLRADTTFPIALVNLTSHKLLITDSDLAPACTQYVIQATCRTEQSLPFEGQGTLKLAPYRSAIWKSRQANISDGDYQWVGWFNVLPEGMDPKWTTVVRMHKEAAKGYFNGGSGTWVLLTTDFTANPEWSQNWDNFGYGLWVTPMASADYIYMDSVMTVSGKRLAVSMYSPDNRSVTVVFRETFWDAALGRGDDYQGWPLRWVSNSSGAVPDR